MLLTNLFLAMFKSSKTKAEPISVNWLNTPSKPEDSTGFEDSTGDTKLVLIEVPVAAVGRGVNSRLGIVNWYASVLGIV
jgi:hypothetical protein